nr:MAG: hypothetical protein 1 [Leviviridae sp.]
MVARSRSMVSTREGGYTARFGTAFPSFSGGEIFRSSSSCDDIVGSGDNAPFHVHKEEWTGGVINKPYTSYYTGYFVDYVADICRGPVVTHLSVDSPTSTAAATSGAARTNPSRPYIDIPVEAGQLAEIVSLLRFRGAGLIRQLAGSNLELQFGILPVMDDLDKLLNLSDQIDRRVRELNKLRSNRGLRRTISIGTYSASEQQTLYVQTQNLFIQEVFDVNTTETVKVHCRWMPDDVSHLATDPAMRALATLAVTGMTLDPSTAWELIPWTWLVDYFTTVGQYFSANRNVVGATLSDVSVMRHTVTTATAQAVDVDGAHFEGCTSLCEDKRRVTSYTSVSADLHLLTENQVGLVASIVATR